MKDTLCHMCRKAITGGQDIFLTWDLTNGEIVHRPFCSWNCVKTFATVMSLGEEARGVNEYEQYEV